MKKNISKYLQAEKTLRNLSLIVLLLGCCPFIFSQTRSASPANLAPTPPMGWASWNHFFCDYNAQTIRDQADALVSTGMRDLGYKYVLIQECIAPGRDAHGAVVVDPVRFPHGMKALVDYIHARGLKAGIYTDVGPYTCNPKPRYQGSFGHEQQDADTFASWGMDLVEMDYCNLPAGHTGREIYERMAAAIQKTGRPMLFYTCSWGNERPWTWAQGKAQLWRTTGDISPKKNHVEWSSIVANFEENAKHATFSAPNSWNDPDMLEVGNPGLNDIEARSHFSMWAISAAPLWAGNDLTRMDTLTRRIYTDAEVIAVDQDPLGAGPTKIWQDNKGLEVWSKPLGSIGSGVDAVLLLNRTAAPADIAVRWSDLTLSGKAKVRDLWTHKDLGEFLDAYSTRIPAHGSALLKVSGNSNWTKGASYEAEWPGNIRGGHTTLLACPQCSGHYAIALHGTANRSAGSSLVFSHIRVPSADKYRMTVFCGPGGPEDGNLQMQVNHGPPIEVPRPENNSSPGTISVTLHSGDNLIALSVRGEKNVDVDRIRVNR